MANVDSPFGLRPVRGANGQPYNGGTNPYYIPASYGTALFIGDPVVKTGTANTAAVSVPGAGEFGIGTMPEINKAAAGDNDQITGVIVSFSPDPSALDNEYNPASTERVANVCDDPNVLFTIQADAAPTNTGDIYGKNTLLIQTAPNTTLNVSRVALDISEISTDAQNPIRIIDYLGGDQGDEKGTTYPILVCKFNYHQHTSTTGSA